MKSQSKLTPQQQTGTQHQQSLQAETAREFATAEELIRFDSAQTPVPDQLAQRVNVSLAQLPQRPPSWWQRLFRR